MIISESVAPRELGEFENLRAWPSIFAEREGLLGGYECCALFLGNEGCVLKACSTARACALSPAKCPEVFGFNLCLLSDGVYPRSFEDIFRSFSGSVATASLGSLGDV